MIDTDLYERLRYQWETYGVTGTDPGSTQVAAACDDVGKAFDHIRDHGGPQDLPYEVCGLISSHAWYFGTLAPHRGVHELAALVARLKGGVPGEAPLALWIVATQARYWPVAEDDWAELDADTLIAVAEALACLSERKGPSGRCAAEALVRAAGHVIDRSADESRRNRLADAAARVARLPDLVGEFVEEMWRLHYWVLAGAVGTFTTAIPSEDISVWTARLRVRELLSGDGHPDTRLEAVLAFVLDILDDYQAEKSARAERAALGLPYSEPINKDVFVMDAAHNLLVGIEDLLPGLSATALGRLATVRDGLSTFLAEHGPRA